MEGFHIFCSMPSFHNQERNNCTIMFTNSHLNIQVDMVNEHKLFRSLIEC